MKITLTAPRLTPQHLAVCQDAYNRGAVTPAELSRCADISYRTAAAMLERAHGGHKMTPQEKAAVDRLHYCADWFEKRALTKTRFRCDDAIAYDHAQAARHRADAAHIIAGGGLPVTAADIIAMSRVGTLVPVPATLPLRAVGY